MSSLVQRWAIGSRMPECKVMAVLAFDFVLCLVLPMHGLAAVLIALTARTEAQMAALKGGIAGPLSQHLVVEPAICSLNLTVMMTCNYVVVCLAVIWFYCRRASVFTLVLGVGLCVWCGTVLGEFVSYECALFEWPSLPPTVRFLGYLLACTRLILQLFDCLYRLVADEPVLESAVGGRHSGWRSERTRQRMQQSRERRAQRRAMRAAAANDALGGQANAAAVVANGASAIEMPNLAASAPPAEPSPLAMSPAVNPNSGSPSSSGPSSGSSSPRSHSHSGSVALSSISVSTGFSSNCVICLGDFPTIASLPQASVQAALGSRFFLPCAHSFHELCIDQWFEACEERSQALCCPTCRQIVQYV